MPPIPHVALLIETSRTYGRDLLRGVRRYIAEHGPWSVYMESRALDSRVPAWLRSWHGDGILTRSASPAIVQAIRQIEVPAVELRATTFKHGFPFLGVDNSAVGKMIAGHLLERGLRHFGVFELPTEDYFQQRRQDFVASLAQRGYPCAVYQAPQSREQPADWEEHQRSLAEWVAALPKPVGIMACTDQLGFWLLDACRRAGVAVPEQAAVVGVENEETLCTMSSPPLSSVQFNGERIGYEAAALLGRLMEGGAPPTGPILVPPLGIVVRRSSDMVALEDEDVAAAVRFIGQHACRGIDAEDVVAEVQLSRSTLERRMRMVLGRSIKAEIARVRFDRVQQLLTDTDLSLAEIARRCGFRYPQYLAEAFRRRFGQTPGTFRGATRR